MVGRPLQVISPVGGGRLGGIVVFRRADLDSSADRWRAAVTVCHVMQFELSVRHPFGRHHRSKQPGAGIGADRRNPFLVNTFACI